MWLRKTSDTTYPNFNHLYRYSLNCHKFDKSAQQNSHLGPRFPQLAKQPQNHDRISPTTEVTTLQSTSSRNDRTTSSIELTRQLDTLRTGNREPLSSSLREIKSKPRTAHSLQESSSRRRTQQPLTDRNGQQQHQRGNTNGTAK